MAFSGIAPTVILIDPLDTVCPRLDQTSSDSDRQAVTSLTNLFDHINKVQEVTFIAITVINSHELGEMCNSHSNYQ